MFIEHASSTRKTVAKILKGYMVSSRPVVPDDVRLGTKMKIPNVELPEPWNFEP